MSTTTNTGHVDAQRLRVQERRVEPLTNNEVGYIIADLEEMRRSPVSEVLVVTSDADSDELYWRRSIVRRGNQGRLSTLAES